MKIKMMAQLADLTNMCGLIWSKVLNIIIKTPIGERGIMFRKNSICLSVTVPQTPSVPMRIEVAVVDWFVPTPHEDTYYCYILFIRSEPVCVCFRLNLNLTTSEK